MFEIIKNASKHAMKSGRVVHLLRAAGEVSLHNGSNVVSVRFQDAGPIGQMLVGLRQSFFKVDEVLKAIVVHGRGTSKEWHSVFLREDKKEDDALSLRIYML